MGQLTVSPNGSGFVCMISSTNEDGDEARVTVIIGKRGNTYWYGEQRQDRAYAEHVVTTDVTSLSELLCHLLFEYRYTVLSGIEEKDRAQEAVRSKPRAKAFWW